MAGYVLVLGASIDQLYLIKSIKQLGLKSLVVDKKKKSPGFKFADKYINIDFSNLKGLKKKLLPFKKKNLISGVITMGCDVPHIIVELKKYLSLKITIPAGSAKISKDKFLMKRFLKKNKIPTAEFIISKNKKKLKKFWFEKKLKSAILKPPNQSGSRGVYQINDIKNLEIILKKIRKISKHEVIFEKFLEGDQISTESLIHKKKIYTPGYVDRDYSLNNHLYPNIIENGAVNPSKHLKHKKKINSIIQKIAKKLNIEKGVIKGDFVINKNKPYIIEFATRLSGGDFSESLVPLGQGINYVKEAVRLEVFGKVNVDKLKNRYNKYVTNKYFFLEGRFKGVKNLKKVEKMNGIKKIFFYKKKNTLIKKIDEHRKRLGVFIVVAKNKLILEKKINKIYNTIIFKVDSFSKKGIF